MTVKDLRDKLELILGDYLGTYTRKSGTAKAIWVGEPPAEWRVSGLECRIAIDPDYSPEPLQNMELSLQTEAQVRLVAHDNGSLDKPLRLMLQRFTDANVSRIPQNENLGILSQVLLRIPL